jgi:hypothetical protein
MRYFILICFTFCFSKCVYSRNNNLKYKKFDFINKYKVEKSDPKAKEVLENKFKVQNYSVNKHDFKFILNPKYDLCGENTEKNKVFLLVYVHTAPDNYKRRLLIRETWAKKSMFTNIRLLFTMGESFSNKTNELLSLENNIYNDIIQEDFIDSYRNLTHKAIMAMKWISKYCKQAQFVLKVDDDIIVNTFAVLRHLKLLSDKKKVPNKAIYCCAWNKAPVTHIFLFELNFNNF